MINEQKLEQVLLDLGHPESLLGTEHIRQAVKIYRPGMSMTKELYPALAEAAGATTSQIERRMRHSIEAAWDRSLMEDRLRYFGGTVSPIKGKPTVSEYVARVARICRGGLCAD